LISDPKCLLETVNGTGTALMYKKNAAYIIVCLEPEEKTINTSDGLVYLIFNYSFVCWSFKSGRISGQRPAPDIRYPI
jgi:hypothetical protein